jgi:hypothetical protein
MSWCVHIEFDIYVLTLHAGVFGYCPASMLRTIVWSIADDKIRPSSRSSRWGVELYASSFHAVPA